MEQYLMIMFRTIFFYVLILLFFRVMGKREIGELSILDLVVFVMIGEMAIVSIDNPKRPLIETIIPMVLLVLIQIGLAMLSLKSKRFRDLVDGKPTIIINKGKIDEQAMRKQRYNFDDLLTQLREKDIRSIADVEFAILESSGSLSVIEKINNPYGEPKEGDITIPLIIDGCIEEENLNRINKTNFWLRQELKKLGYRDVKKISFCSYENGKFFVDLIDEE
ncbi:MAG: rane protein [Neobacillus sp.]|nr:rane protein [Neobacillus sp.]